MRGKIIVACDSFKGSLTSTEAGNAVAEGVREAWPDSDVEVLAVGDGGEGTLEAIASGLNATEVNCTVHGPDGNTVNAFYAIKDSTAIIEMAQASGLNLVSKTERDPLHATTYGTGDLIADAISRGCRHFIIGLGGSATNDGGTGMLRALGLRFLTRQAQEIGDDLTALSNLAHIDISNALPELAQCNFTALCDVDTPLTGSNGATRIFGPQKGADAEMIGTLESGLEKLAQITTEQFGKDFSTIPGSGAAGGLGFALIAFLHAEIKSGIDAVLDTIGFDDKIENASMVITGEGRIDSQTVHGKAPTGILQRASKLGLPVIAIGGAVEKKAIPALKSLGFKDIIEATPPEMPLSIAMQTPIAKENIKTAVKSYFLNIRR